MNSELRSLLAVNGGLVTRARATQVLPRWVLDHACARGHLRRVLPGVYLDAEAPLDHRIRSRAALAWLDGRGALSHTSALDIWGLHDAAARDAVHVTVASSCRLRSQSGVVVHRRHGFTPEPPHAIVRGGRLVTPLEQALVDAWPLLPAAQRRAPVIRAVNDRMTTVDRLRVVTREAPKLPAGAQWRRLLDLLAEGCRSPLEIWGHEHVFTGPGMPEFRRQVRVRLGGRSVYLDVYAEREMVNVELDGASVHAGRRQREIDLRRDAQLAALGILVVRFTHRRLVYDTEAVRREVLAILARRQALTARPA